MVAQHAESVQAPTCGCHAKQARETSPAFTANSDNSSVGLRLAWGWGAGPGGDPGSGPATLSPCGLHRGALGVRGRCFRGWSGGLGLQVPLTLLGPYT